MRIVDQCSKSLSPGPISFRHTLRKKSVLLVCPLPWLMLEIWLTGLASSRWWLWFYILTPRVLHSSSCFVFRWVSSISAPLSDLFLLKFTSMASLANITALEWLPWTSQPTKVLWCSKTSLNHCFFVSDSHPYSFPCQACSGFCLQQTSNSPDCSWSHRLLSCWGWSQAVAAHARPTGQWPFSSSF